MTSSEHTTNEAFDRWLEKEHGPISVYDFEHRFAMEHWIKQMRSAFEAGQAVSK